MIHGLFSCKRGLILFFVRCLLCVTFGIIYLLSYTSLCCTDVNGMNDEMFILCLGYGYVRENKLIHVWWMMRCLYCVLVMVMYVRISWYMFDFISKRVWYRFFLVVNEYHIFINVSHWVYSSYIFITLFCWYFYFFYGLYKVVCLINWCACIFMWFMKAFVSNKNDVFGLTMLWFF